jgi:hypothetical protein
VIPMNKLLLSPHDKLLIMQSITWLKTMNEAQPAGSPPVYPKAADIDSSGLFKRIRAGLTPMPWAPPTRNGHPAYDLIEDARSEHPALVAPAATPDHLLLDDAAWRVVAKDPNGSDYRLAFGNWPLSYRATAREVKRWPRLPADLDEGSAQELVRLADGRLLSKEVLRRERDQTETQWRLRCCSPLNEHLYLTAQRLPLDIPANFSPAKIHVGSASRPLAFECRPFAAGIQVLFALCQDPWTKVTRYLSLSPSDDSQLNGWLESYRREQSLIGFAPNATSWRVYEIAEDGRPLSGWETTRPELLQPVDEAADQE